MLEQRVDVNASQVDGMTALHWAAYHDDLETAQLLVRAGANVKAENRYGVTPLSLACQNGNSPLVELLLKGGADPNATLRGGETALMTAARTGKPGVVKALLARGAASRHGTARTNGIMWAAAEVTQVVELLIEAGADFHPPLSDSGFTPLFFAAREGRIGGSPLVESGVDVNGTYNPALGKVREGNADPGGGTVITSCACLLEAALMLMTSVLVHPLHTMTWSKPPRGEDRLHLPWLGNLSSLNSCN